MSKSNPTDLLGDIEDLISDDWGEVHKQFLLKEEREAIEEPVIPDFPSYEDFYALLVDMSFEQYLTPQWAEIVHRFTRKRGRKVPPAFSKLWTMFCDSYRYGVAEMKCECGREWAVIYEKEERPRIRDIDLWRQESTMTIRRETVACNRCGKPMLHISGTLVGVMSNGRHDVKFESRTDF